MDSLSVVLPWHKRSYFDTVRGFLALTLPWHKRTYMDTLYAVSARNIFAVLGFTIMAWIISVIVYRLYFHPLAKIPGPKLAAVSRLYELYYQAVEVTEFPHRIHLMHKKYGPIVRISPEEVSINDAKFNLAYLTKGQDISKDPWYYGFGYSHTVIAMLDKPGHRIRSRHLNNYFFGSYFKSYGLPIITREIADLSKKFEGAAAAQQILNASTCFRKTSNEVLRTFLLGKTSWDSKDNGKKGTPKNLPLFETIAILRHFGWLKKLELVMPSFIADMLVPVAKYANEAQHGLKQLIDAFDVLPPHAQSEIDGVMYRLINDVPEYRLNECATASEEFMEFLWGGREAIGSSLVQICMQLISNPDTMSALHKELAETDIDLSEATYNELRKLPYLNAVCKEGLRLTWGGSFRMPRVSSNAVQFNDYIIPADTPISTCPNFFHQDPDIFTNPQAFSPERWLSVDPEHAKIMDTYWRPFGGACQGRYLALEVIWATVAHVFVKNKLEFVRCNPDSLSKDGSLKVFPPPKSTGLQVRIDSWDEEAKVELGCTPAQCSSL